MTGNGTYQSPYIVGTWAEFLSVCTQADKFIQFADGGGTVDFSTEYPNGVKSLSINARCIDGNGWTIKNIILVEDFSKYTAVFNSKAIMKNFNFVDFKISGTNAALFYSYDATSNTNGGYRIYNTFENCAFDGTISGDGAAMLYYIQPYNSLYPQFLDGYKQILWACNLKIKFEGNFCTITNVAAHSTNCIFDIDGSEMVQGNALENLLLQNCIVNGNFHGIELTGDVGKTNSSYDAGYTIVNANSDSAIQAGEVTRAIIANKNKAAIGENVIGATDSELKSEDFLTAVGFPIGNGNPQIVSVSVYDLVIGAFNVTNGADVSYNKMPIKPFVSDWIPINLGTGEEDTYLTLRHQIFPGTPSYQTSVTTYIRRSWAYVLKKADGTVVAPPGNDKIPSDSTTKIDAQYTDCVAIRIMLYDGSNILFNAGFDLYVGKIWQINKAYNNGFPYTIFMDVPYNPPPKPKPIRENLQEYITIYSQETPQDGFETHGLGVLSPTKCEITEELNGKLELSIEHPIDDDGKWRYIKPFAIIKALGQLFTVRLVDEKWTGSKGTISAKADHIFYQLNDAWIHPGNILLSSNHAAGIISHIANITDRQIREGQIYYNFAWDIPPELTVTDNFLENWSNLSSGATFSEFIMGSNGLLIGTSGEIYRDNFYFSIAERIENFNGNAFDIRVGKNLRGIKRTIDTTRLCTYFRGFDDFGNELDVAYESFPLISPPHYVVRSQKFSYNIDSSLPLEERIEKSNQLLTNDVFLFFEQNCVPKISYEVDLEDVEKNADYFEFEGTPDYRVGNIGYVHDERLGGAIRLKISKTIKDAITGKTISVTFGDNLDDSSAVTSRSAIEDLQITPMAKKVERSMGNGNES